MRPGMYIGDTTLRGLHHLVYEVVDNSIDEALAGHCKNIQVTVHADGSASIIDDGRGIPVGPHHQFTDQSTLEVVLTKPHAGGKFDHDTYKVSGGLHGVGVTVVNALSEWLEAEIHRDGKVWRQDYRQGEAQGPDPPGRRRQGHRDHDPVPARRRRSSRRSNSTTTSSRSGSASSRSSTRGSGSPWPTSGATSRSRRSSTRRAGLAEFVAYLNRAQTPIHPPVVLSGRDDERAVEVDVALQYNESISETVVSYCNNIHTIEGGTHLTGFRTALTRTLNIYAKAATVEEQGPRDHRRGLQGRADGDRERPGARPAVRGADQDEAGQQRGRGDRRRRSSTTSSASSSSRTPRRPRR